MSPSVIGLVMVAPQSATVMRLGTTYSTTITAHAEYSARRMRAGSRISAVFSTTMNTCRHAHPTHTHTHTHSMCMCMPFAVGSAAATADTSSSIRIRGTACEPLPQTGVMA
jgi:hypothetical protein